MIETNIIFTLRLEKFTLRFGNRYIEQDLQVMSDHTASVMDVGGEGGVKE